MANVDQSLIKSIQFAALLLVALSVGASFAHVLEMPQKMRLEASFYTAVNGSLYRWFAIIGAILQFGSIVATLLLALLVRGKGPIAAWTVAGTVLVWLGFAAWWLIVFPVNRRVAAAPAESLPTLWMSLRPRWEYGHSASFAILLLGMCALLISLLTRHPAPGGQ